jgi:hypothetical protein
MGGRASRSDRAGGDAAEALYAAPLSAFTEERKRLADELRQAGEADAAERLARLGKPSVSAWVVNRLYRDARKDLDQLLEAGRRMRAGDAAATGDQRAALARLNRRAADILRADGHAPSRSMLRRVTTTLQALSFEPDRPGQLVRDRDPPGFDLLAGVPLAPPEPEKRRPARAARGEPEETGAAPDPAERQRRQRAAAQRKLLERSAAQASRRADARAGEVESLRADLERAEAAAERLRTALRAAEQQLADARAAADAAIAALTDE